VTAAPGRLTGGMAALSWIGGGLAGLRG